MLESTTTRHNPLIDPALSVWSWEIPVYLFLGGVVAGMMVLGGVAMVRIARGEDPRGFFSVQTPLLGFILINLGMGALFLDLTHKLYVWRVYTTFQPSSPMSWGSWVLIVVYGVLAASALVRLPQTWPWLTRRVPVLARLSDGPFASTTVIRALGYSNIVLGVALGLYTGILLNTMIARPLWNSAILAPLFLVSGLSAGAAMIHLLPASWQPLGEAAPPRRTAEGLIRADLVFLAVEVLLIAGLLAHLFLSSPSHANAAWLLVSGPYATAFWGVIVIAGLVAPIALQGLELKHRIPHTVVPALLVLAGGLALRWVMVGAGQASHVLQTVAN